jgi:hypothetical protein
VKTAIAQTVLQQLCLAPPPLLGAGGGAPGGGGVAGTTWVEQKIQLVEVSLFFLESIFIDHWQATLNGTRPDSPSGVKPARPLVVSLLAHIDHSRTLGLLPRWCDRPSGEGPTSASITYYVRVDHH